MTTYKTELERIAGANAVWIPEPSAFGMIKPGDRVEIIKNGKNDDVSYKSKVMDILNFSSKEMSVFVPSSAGKPLVMQADEVYSLVIHTRDYLLKFECSFRGHVKEEANYFAVIKILNEGIKLQRREFFRFTCMLAMKFSVMYTGDNEAAKLLQNSGYSTMHNGIIRDIGGGGIRVITNEDLEAEDNLIQCTIMLGHTAMLIKGKILDKQYMPKSNMKFQYRALFLDVSQATQDEIVNFIFAEQRKQKKFKQVPLTAK